MRRRGVSAWLRASAVASLLAPASPAGPDPGAALAATVAARPPAARLEQHAEARRVTALGRLEPKDGILRVAGPSRPSVVVSELFVEEGDRVRVGQPVAELDTRPMDAARVAGARAGVATAEAERVRVRRLFEQRIATRAALDRAELALAVARAELDAARAALAMDTVRAPVAGQVLRILTHRGERVGAEGILELAQNHEMYAIAEVYETDIGRVAPGQRASVSSPALAAPLSGRVERIGMQIGKLDTLDTDPVAAIDARVVEVHVRLDDSARAAPLANLQVYVSIESGPGAEAAR